MTSNGYNVMGWYPDTDPNNAGNIKRDTVQALRIMNQANMQYPPAATTNAVVSGSVDKYDTDINSVSGKIMNLEIYDNQGYKYTVKMSVHAVEPDANNVGSDHGQFSVQVDDILDVNGDSILGDTDAEKAASSVRFGGQPVGTGIPLMYVDGQGEFLYVGAADQKTAQLTFEQGTSTNFPSFDPITIDFSTTTNYNVNKVSTLNAEKGGLDGVTGTGRKVGDLSGITIQKDGMIYLDYDNGQTKLVGQIAVASFANPSGLAKEGDNLYSATMNSGEFNGIGVDITEGGGYMESGVLEMSNVDLASEFTQMITTQRGFQANSRIITVSDTLLEELTNLKR